MLTGVGAGTGLAFRALDRRIGVGNDWRRVGAKVVLTQMVLNPPYLLLLFGVLGALEGRNELTQNAWAKAVAALPANFLFWPPANLVNFRFIPASWRVAYVAACGGAWNTYLSMLNKAHGDSS